MKYYRFFYGDQDKVDFNFNVNDEVKIDFAGKDILGTLFKHDFILAKYIREVVVPDFSTNSKSFNFTFGPRQEVTPELIKYLISEGASVDHENTLCSLVKENHFDLFKIFVEAGAKIIINCDFAIKAAFENRNIEILHFLQDNNMGTNACKNLNNLLYHAVFVSNYEDGWNFLIENGADIHYDNDFIFHKCVCEGCTKKAKKFLELGINVNSRNNLEWAIRTKNLSLVKILLQAGATLTKEHIELAQKKNYLEILKVLEENWLAHIIKE
jgi:ankyrin repeat protein